MKTIRALLEHAGIDPPALRELFAADGAVTYALTVDGEMAVEVWEDMRRLAPAAGCWPLLLGQLGEEDLPAKRMTWIDGQGEVQESYPTYQAILEEAQRIDARSLLERWHAQKLASCRELLARAEAAGDEEEADYHRSFLQGPEELQGVSRGKWPRGVEPTSPWSIAAGITDGRDGGWREVTLALLPVAHGWDAPAVMKFGKWNDNPEAAQHVSLMRHWHERYGAELVVMTEDTVEFMVARPPRKRREALLLARDHYLYCPDCIDQGHRTLEALAATLLRGEAWYFWWD